MKILFAGTPEVAVPTLQALYDSQHDIAAVITRPPARRGRSKRLVASAVSQAAQELGIEVIESSNPSNPETLARITELQPDLGVVVAYGAILRPEVLSVPKNGWINLHFSDLPRWRGAAPVQHAIRAKDTHAATCVFQLEKGLDTGPIYSKELVDLNGYETTGSLLDSLAEVGAQQVVRVVTAIEEGSARAIPQSENGITIAGRLTKSDAFVSFELGVSDTDALIRSVTPAPGAWTTLPNGKPLKLGPVTVPLPPVAEPGDLKPGTLIADKSNVYVACADGVVRLGNVAPAGKGSMDALAWWRGARLEEGARLGELQ